MPTINMERKVKVIGFDTQYGSMKVTDEEMESYKDGNLDFDELLNKYGFDEDGADGVEWSDEEILETYPSENQDEDEAEDEDE